MDLMEMGDVGSGCEDNNCGLALGFQEDCTHQECETQETVFGFFELVCVTVIYIPLMLFGLLGNILTILVVWLRPHMRSSTYLYLSSMAVSDLLILLLLPLDLYKLWRPRPWPLGDLACKLTMFLSECCTFCTILHITFLSLERYLAVCWPITAKTVVTRRRTRALIGCLWLGAVVSAAPVLVMVGVEEVGGEELGHSGWREEGGWTGGKGEQGAYIIDGGERESAHMLPMDREREGLNWEEKEKKGWGERVGEIKWFGVEEESQLATGETEEKKQGDGGGMKDEKEADEDGGAGKKEVDGKQQNRMKEDEGGGWRREEADGGGHEGELDKRECRCTHYALSSGLLSAMMILSNLYFLIPLCILGLVYSLIGRTLWLRPQSSRKDQSHRHTVKMLGVIVLAFVLCWLPFHVGRTIFFFSLGTGNDGQEMHMDPNSHLDINMPSYITDGDINTHTVTMPCRHSDSDTHLETLSETRHMTKRADKEGDKVFCDICANTHSEVETHLTDTGTEIHSRVGARAEDMSTGKHLYSHFTSHTRGQHGNTDMITQNSDPSIEMDARTNTHTEIYNDPAHINAPPGKFSDSRDTNTQIHDTTAQKKQNKSSICMHSENDAPPAADANTHAVTPSDQDGDNTHLNGTYMHHDRNSYFLYYVSQYFNLVSSVLFYLSAAVNPLLYNLMSARYRHAVHSLIHTHSPTQSHRLRTTLTARHSTTTM